MLPLCLGKLQVSHNFVVVHSLIVPVILGVDFLQKYNLVLDFGSNPVSINSKSVDGLDLGAPASFPRLMDKICRDLSFATTYLDDLIHSQALQEHIEHLHILFEHLSSAGLTL